jgi:hypothetical protein
MIWTRVRLPAAPVRTLNETLSPEEKYESTKEIKYYNKNEIGGFISVTISPFKS